MKLSVFYVSFPRRRESRQLELDPRFHGDDKLKLKRYVNYQKNHRQ